MCRKGFSHVINLVFTVTGLFGDCGCSQSQEGTHGTANWRDGPLSQAATDSAGDSCPRGSRILSPRHRTHPSFLQENLGRGASYVRGFTNCVPVLTPSYTVSHSYPLSPSSSLHAFTSDQKSRKREPRRCSPHAV